MNLYSYPTVKDYRAMITSPEYEKIAPMRTDSVDLGLWFPFSIIQ